LSPVAKALTGCALHASPAGSCSFRLVWYTTEEEFIAGSGAAALATAAYQHQCSSMRHMAKTICPIDLAGCVKQLSGLLASLLVDYCPDRRLVEVDKASALPADIGHGST
jgi:hypothetical protein